MMMMMMMMMMKMMKHIDLAAVIGTCCRSVRAAIKSTFSLCFATYLICKTRLK